MLHVTVLGSGSAGNCSVVESAGTRVLVDAGLSARQIVNRLAEIGVDPASLEGILITHEHIDHVCGLQVFLKKYRVPIYCNRMTGEALKLNGATEMRIFQTRSGFEVGDIAIETFDVPHDAAEPVGFVLSCSESVLGFVTDLGFATAAIRERIRNAHTLVVEANHDEKLLQDDTKRPWAVKQRIMSRHGHLSNLAAAKMVGEVLHDGMRRVVLGHLSHDCNSPELAISTVREHLATLGGPIPEIHCATQKQRTERFCVR